MLNYKSAVWREEPGPTGQLWPEWLLKHDDDVREISYSWVRGEEEVSV